MITFQSSSGFRRHFDLPSSKDQSQGALNRKQLTRKATIGGERAAPSAFLINSVISNELVIDDIQRLLVPADPWTLMGTPPAFVDKDKEKSQTERIKGLRSMLQRHPRHPRSPFGG